MMLLVAVLGVILGGLSAWSAIERARGQGSLAIGPWSAVVYAGASDIDPYTVAKTVIDGSVPLGATEGLTFYADTDSAGRALDLSCDYAIVGTTPQAKLWTMTAYRADATPVENAPGGRSSAWSGAVVRFPDGTFKIDLSANVRPGNWMGVAGAGPFRLALRLYDTPLISSSGVSAPDMPAIRKGNCR
jgi:hypothetical protein